MEERAAEARIPRLIRGQCCFFGPCQFDISTLAAQPNAQQPDHGPNMHLAKRRIKSAIKKRSASDWKRSTAHARLAGYGVLNTDHITGRLVRPVAGKKFVHMIRDAQGNACEMMRDRPDSTDCSRRKSEALAASRISALKTRGRIYCT